MTMNALSRLFALIFLCAPSVAAAAGSVVVPAQAEVRGTHVRLGDVAHITGLKGEARAQIADIDLGAAPTVGEGRLLPRAALLAALREAGVPANVQIRLPDRLELTRATRLLKGAELVSEVESRFRSQVPADVELASVRVPTLPDLRVPVEATYEVRVEVPADLSQSVSAEIVVKDGDQLVRSQKVLVHVDAVGTAYVAAAPLARGRALSGSDFEAQRLPMSQIPADAVRSTDELDGATLRRDVKDGETLTRRYLEMPPLVKRGDRVTMIAQRGGIRISAQGEAMGPARRGESVKIRNVDSLKIVSGRVTGPQLVEMEM